MSEQPRDLCDDISDEADLCRNEGAADIADLLDEARQEILKLRSDKDIMSGELEVLRAHAESSRKRQAHLYKESVEGATVAAAELSRLRDLVREMRDSLDDVTRMLEAAFMTDYEPQQGSVGGIAKALIAKADAILKESGHE